MMTALPKKLYSLEEYIQLEKSSEEKYEYFDGEVFAMAGGTINYERISKNLLRRLEEKLEGSTCETLPSNVRIKAPAAFPYRYPDASVVCGELIIEEIFGQQMLVNPLVIIEVLSSSTAAYDLGSKFSAYQSISSFREYLLISQDRAHIIQYVRQPNDKWLRSETSGLESTLMLESLGITLTLSEIYQRVNFQPEIT